jgi:hypothetical protein
VKVHRRQWPLGIVSDYSRVFNFSEGLACVELNREYGFIDKAGSLAIPAIYDDAKAFKETGSMGSGVRPRWLQN